MLILLIALTALSFIVTIGSGIWWILRTGQIRPHSGRDAGAEVMAGLGEEETSDDQIQAFGAAKQVFKGTGIKVEGSAESSFADMKRQLAAGDRRAALPPLIAAAGLLATVLFGSLAFFVGIEDRLIGGIIAAIAIFTVIRLVYDFIRA